METVAGPLVQLEELVQELEEGSDDSGRVLLQSLIGIQHKKRKGLKLERLEPLISLRLPLLICSLNVRL